jgi:hypothetical protein
MLLLKEGGFSSVEMRVLQVRMAEGRAQAVLKVSFLVAAFLRRTSTVRPSLRQSLTRTP